jgi:hypothetical protein
VKSNLRDALGRVLELPVFFYLISASVPHFLASSALSRLNPFVPRKPFPFLSRKSFRLADFRIIFTGFLFLPERHSCHIGLTPGFPVMSSSGLLVFLPFPGISGGLRKC